MKAIIAADIHGDLEHTKKLYKLCEKEDPELIILLGDLLNNYYHNDYFAVEEIISIMNRWSARTIAAKGNTDSINDLERLLFPVVETYDEVELDGIPFYYTHGHLNDKLALKFKNHFVLSGHTHRYNLDGYFINPGSVGLPRYSRDHTCLIYANKQFKLINLDDFSIMATKDI